VIARLAHGHANDLLSTLCLATTAPIAIVPAMNNRMWLHPATQANVALLRDRHALWIGPDDGSQACGEFGPGRMSEPAAIVAALVAARAPLADGPLQGQRVLVSAGPTYEDLDPVRYIGNRSSGKMGFAIAAAAAALGADVTLVAGPVSLPTPAGVRRIDVRRALEMHDAVMASLPQDIYIGAAAVADYMPARTATDKIKKPLLDEGGDAGLRDSGMTLELVRTPDILAEVAVHAQRPRLVVGFAAETRALADSARDKLQRKRVDAIAANRVGVADSGFDCDDNALSVYWNAAEGHVDMAELGPASKTRVARELLGLLLDRISPTRKRSSA
jgi:phosphopantothenoylcysteine decarboxylase/phosphopantothenate--cysteine ligase